MNGFKWELYNINEDWTQANDLAATMPDKLRDMQQLFTMEATKYQRLPARRHAACSGSSRTSRATRPAGPSSPTRATLSNVPFPDTGTAPSLLNRSYTITAEIEVPQGGAEGMLMTDGGRFAGYGFYLLKGRPVFTWNLLGLERVKWQGKEALAPGKHTLVFDWKYDGPGLGKGGTGTLEGGRQGRGQPSHAAAACRSPSRGTRPSTSASTPARRWTTRTTRCRSASPARSTS